MSKANITFLAKTTRNSVKLNNVPVLVALSEDDVEDERDIILGVVGIFDAFEITFKKSQNKIVLKKVSTLFP